MYKHIYLAFLLPFVVNGVPNDRPEQNATDNTSKTHTVLFLENFLAGTGRGFLQSTLQGFMHGALTGSICALSGYNPDEDPHDIVFYGMMAMHFYIATHIEENAYNTYVYEGVYLNNDYTELERNIARRGYLLGKLASYALQILIAPPRESPGVWNTCIATAHSICLANMATDIWRLYINEDSPVNEGSSEKTEA